MIVLGGIEGLQGNDLGDDGVGPEGCIGKLFDDGGGGLLLGGSGKKDGRTVLGAHVSALTVEGSGVVDGEEDVQQVSVGDDGGVEGDPDGLGVTGDAGADELIRGVGPAPAAVAGDDVGNAADLAKDGFETPEAAAGKDGLLKGLCVHDVIVLLIGVKW